MKKIISIYLEDFNQTIYELEGKPDIDIRSKLVLVIAGNNNEFSDYKNTHFENFNLENCPKDHLINVLEVGSVEGINADYIKVIGTAAERPDYLKLLNACKLRLR